MEKTIDKKNLRKTLDELIREQGVKPVADLKEIADKWPGDEEPEEVLNFILEERKSRREAAKE